MASLRFVHTAQEEDQRQRAEYKGKESFLSALPISEYGRDPWIIRSNGHYYYVLASRDNLSITMQVADSLAQVGQAKAQIIFDARENEEQFAAIWAPELHFLDNRWYIYFAATSRANTTHRMFVLESASEDALSPYAVKGKITDPSDSWGIDGTILELNPTERYYIWSGWAGEEDGLQGLYIAKMANPWTLEGKRVCISEPEYEWERQGYPLVNEGPQVLKNNETVHVIYSASFSGSDHYCLGSLRFKGGDVRNPSAWEKHPEPLFRSGNERFAPGHASFVTDEAGLDWIFYHCGLQPGAGWETVVQAQPFRWHETGVPEFGQPLGIVV